MKGRRGDGHPAPVQRVTDAPVPLSMDVRRRQRRYVVTMAFRIVCFMLAIVASGWLRWALVVGAVILPWIAVLIANAGRERGAPVDAWTQDAARGEHHAIEGPETAQEQTSEEDE